MKRAMFIVAALVLACGVSTMATAEEAGHREGHAWFGTFEKTPDGKIVFKSNNESHAVAAGDHAKDDVKNKLTNAEKELVGQGTFQVIGNIKENVIMANAIVKKSEGHGDHAGGGDHKDGGAPGAPAPGGGGDDKK